MDGRGSRFGGRGCGAWRGCREGYVEEGERTHNTQENTQNLCASPVSRRGALRGQQREEGVRSTTSTAPHLALHCRRLSENNDNGHVFRTL